MSSTDSELSPQPKPALPTKWYCSTRPNIEIRKSPVDGGLGWFCACGWASTDFGSLEVALRDAEGHCCEIAGLNGARGSLTNEVWEPSPQPKPAPSPYENEKHQAWVESGRCSSISQIKSWCNYFGEQHVDHYSPGDRIPEFVWRTSKEWPRRVLVLRDARYKDTQNG